MKRKYLPLPLALPSLKVYQYQYFPTHPMGNYPPSNATTAEVFAWQQAKDEEDNTREIINRIQDDRYQIYFRTVLYETAVKLPNKKQLYMQHYLYRTKWAK